jgi:hypothetical protein
VIRYHIDVFLHATAAHRAKPAVSETAGCSRGCLRDLLAELQTAVGAATHMVRSRRENDVRTQQRQPPAVETNAVLQTTTADALTSPCTFR